MEKVRFRPAWLHESETLTALALRSKAHWGYDAAFMAATRAELTITEDRLREDAYIVVDTGPRTAPIAMYALSGSGDTLEVENFFIEPAHIGKGLGRQMMEHCKKLARAHGATALKLDADPHAAAFYAAMGFETAGESPSGSIPGRALPHMRLSLTSRASRAIDRQAN